MYNFILQTVSLLSLGVVVFLFTRALPVAHKDNDQTKKKSNGSSRGPNKSKLSLDKLDSTAHALIEKFLRKLKIIVMRTDNLINKKIKSLKRPNEEDGDRQMRELFSDKEKDILQSSTPEENSTDQN